MWKALSPDGLHYAWIDESGSGSVWKIHVTDAVTGADRAFSLPTVRGAWSVVEYTEAGIYLNAFQGMEGQLGLWLVTPNSGVVTQLDDSWNWTEVGNGAAWGIAEDGILKRLDLTSHKVTTVLGPAHPSPQLATAMTRTLLSLDAQGRPVIAFAVEEGTYAGAVAAISVFNANGELALYPTLPPRWQIFAERVHVGRGLLMSSGIWLTGSGFGLALLTGEGRLMELTRQPEVFAVSGGGH